MGRTLFYSFLPGLLYVYLSQMLTDSVKIVYKWIDVQSWTVDYLKNITKNRKNGFLLQSLSSHWTISPNVLAKNPPQAVAFTVSQIHLNYAFLGSKIII